MRMNFGQALEALKEGELVRRRCWSKGAFIHSVLTSDSELSIAIEAIGAERQLGWAPSQADMFADDWESVNLLTLGKLPS